MASLGWIVLAVAAAGQTATPGPPVLAEEPPPAAAPLPIPPGLTDAWLHDVCFVDPQNGWAVGDRGAIWNTTDGGETWRLQPSGVSCPLQSVWFLDPLVGWAAGGSIQPRADLSEGVLLWTDDGGRRWHRNNRLNLPRLAKVRFFDRQFGWAVGDSSAVFPSGVYSTRDGGKTWNSLGGTHKAGWIAADQIDPRTGAVAGRLGGAESIREGALRPCPAAPRGPRTLRALRLVPPTWGWLAGDGGLVMLTGDLGATWQSPPGELPLGDSRDWDFLALTVRGPKCWVAGSPGSRIFLTEDAGQNWAAAATGQSLPISALAFADDRFGWAVGALGTILATTDGGRTWRAQRGGGQRAALLGLFSRPEDVPLEMLARVSGNEGYLGIVEVLNRRDDQTPVAERLSPEGRLCEAVLRVGASGAGSAWAFPLDEDALKLADRQILQLWDQTNDGRGWAMLQAHLVRQIRLWRPEVLVTHAPSPRGDRPRDHLVNQAVLEAVAQAADPTAWPGQIAQAGLAPWRVKKVYGMLEPGMEGTVEVAASEMADRLGRSLGELAAEAREILDRQYQPGPDAITFQLMLSQLDQAPGRDDFFAGIALPPGGEARRAVLDASRESLTSLGEIAQRRRNVRMILRHAETNPAGAASLLARVDALTEGMGPVDGGRVLHELAEQYKRTGQWDSAAGVLQRLVERCPGHPLAGDAQVWLVQYYASAEAAWRIQGPQRRTEIGTGVRPASTLSIDALTAENRPERAAQAAKRLQSIRPDLAAEPAVGFPAAVADRMRGFSQEAERYLMLLRRSPDRDAWWTCAMGEAWLADPQSEPPKPVLVCVAAPSKPKLDGRLDEPFWKSAKPAGLASPARDDDAWGGSARLAYDAQFLYLAVECRRAAGASYPEGRGRRPRDGDLSDHDRVDLLLDLDRDYVTYYRLTVDHRGWTNEGCWGDPTWDPDWFVAAAVGEGTWTVEAAVPLDQLTGRYPRSRDVWAVGLQRIVPGVGFQSWNTPAAATVVPEGFGYLIFE